MKRTIDWGLLQSHAGQRLNAEDAQILAMLVQGKSTPQIAAHLGVNRSRIWRRYLELKKQLVDQQS
jgi:DNA-binding CsgD family transcriptional regulator